jgi:hypothetical protein
VPWSAFHTAAAPDSSSRRARLVRARWWSAARTSDSARPSALLICGALKILYDVLLLMQFRHLKPPEER